MKISDAINAFFGSAPIKSIMLGEELMWPKVSASGGVETVYEKDGRYYRLHEFNEDGTLSVSKGGPADVLIVAGGGSGIFGGGGGGGVIYDTMTLVPGSHAATVGEGGSASVSGITVFDQGKGENSEFLGLVAIGGGGGAYHVLSENDLAEMDGGSGGGGDDGFEPVPPGSGTSGQGHDGGASDNTDSDYGYSGSGGGAGGPGTGRSGSSQDPEDPAPPGPGLFLDITGQLEEYGRGGWGGAWDPRTSWESTPFGTSNRGTGGNGWYRNLYEPTRGTSGVVMVRYEISQSEFIAENGG